MILQVISFFASKLEKEGQSHVISSAGVLDLIVQASKTWPRDRLRVCAVSSVFTMTSVLEIVSNRTVQYNIERSLPVAQYIHIKTVENIINDKQK